MDEAGPRAGRKVIARTPKHTPTAKAVSRILARAVRRKVVPLSKTTFFSRRAAPPRISNRRGVGGGLRAKDYSHGDASNAL